MEFGIRLREIEVLFNILQYSFSTKELHAGGWSQKKPVAILDP
jgi:hypothetical protein